MAPTKSGAMFSKLNQFANNTPILLLPEIGRSWAHRADLKFDVC